MEPTEVGTRLFFTHPERDQRDTARSAAASSVFHILMVLLLVLLSRAGMHLLAVDQGAGTGVGAGPAGGGGGGGSEEQVSVLIPEPPADAPEEPQVTVPDKVQPVPTIPVPELEVPKLDSVPQPSAVPSPSTSTSTSGTSQADGIGPGTGPGVGPGAGGGSGGGEGGGTGSGVGPGSGKGRISVPTPEVLIVPPPGPGRVRGKVVTVRMTVDSVGVVKSAEVIPSTGDRKYDDTLKRTALGWRFRPARDATNKPITVVFDVIMTVGQ